MSRWSKRTQEEKLKIKETINHQKQIKQDNIERLNRACIDHRLKILKQTEIPLFCPKHGWTSSNQYTLETRNDIFGDTIYILGKCPQCNASLETTIAKDPMYIMMVSLNLAKLKQQNRITDNRSKS